jgi:short-subunit dehydrogenase
MTGSQVVIVTGASGGIGSATARLLAGEGYRVVVASRKETALRAVAAEIQNRGGDALPLATDITIPKQIENLVDGALAHYGRVDVLVNNAGTIYVDWLERLTPEEIEAQLAVNVAGMIQAARAVLPHMLERRSGHIINMSSMAGLIPVPTYTVYTATKYAVRGFSDALRREVKPEGIRVSALYPGGVVTEFTQKAGRKRVSASTTPGALALSPEQVAQAVLSLLKYPRRSLILPWFYRYIAPLETLLPGLVDRVIQLRFANLRRPTTREESDMLEPDRHRNDQS